MNLQVITVSGTWISSCGGVVIATTSTDYITPWNGSQQNYDPSLICQWKIKTRSDSTLKLKLTQLDLTSTASVRNCSSQPTLEVSSIFHKSEVFEFVFPHIFRTS